METVPEIVEKGDRTHLVFPTDVSMVAFMEKSTSSLGADKLNEILLAMGDFNSQLTFSTEDYKKHIAPLL